MFLLYVNDLANVSENLFTIMFADDTNVFVSGNNEDSICTIMNENLKLLYDWLNQVNANKLSLNVKKTNYMLFRPRLKICKSDLPVKINSQYVSKSEKIKFLGVVLDARLLWKAHVQYVSNKLAKGIGILCKAKKYLNRETLVNMYYTFVYPYFTYCITVWGGGKYRNITTTCKTTKKNNQDNDWSKTI